MEKITSDGLMLRSLSCCIPNGRSNLAQFYTEVFAEDGWIDADGFADWTLDITSKNHPSSDLNNFWVIVDPSKNDRIVSALLLVPQVWCYGQIEFGVGRLELIATHKEYRHKGLVRALMTTAQQRSEALGHLMQAIMGIPNYYRQFGYGMAVDMGSSLRLPMAAIPVLKPGHKSKYRLRAALLDDISAILALDRQSHNDCLLTEKRDAARWEFELKYRSDKTRSTRQLYIIADQLEQNVGFVSLFLHHLFPDVVVMDYALDQQASFLSTSDDVLQEIKKIADSYFTANQSLCPSINIAFNSGLHPDLLQIIQGLDDSIPLAPYAWYLRVSDISGFINKISPVLNERMARASTRDFTGDLKLGFFGGDDIQLDFQKGSLISVVAGNIHWKACDVLCPYELFLNILLGHRSIDDIKYIMPEVSFNQKGHLLLNVLFPKMQSLLDTTA